jgi:hypothetical protein
MNRVARVIEIDRRLAGPRQEPGDMRREEQRTVNTLQALGLLQAPAHGDRDTQQQVGDVAS